MEETVFEKHWQGNSKEIDIARMAYQVVLVLFYFVWFVYMILNFFLSSTFEWKTSFFLFHFCLYLQSIPNLWGGNTCLLVWGAENLKLSVIQYYCSKTWLIYCFLEGINSSLKMGVKKNRGKVYFEIQKLGD